MAKAKAKKTTKKKTTKRTKSKRTKSKKTGTKSKTKKTGTKKKSMSQQAREILKPHLKKGKKTRQELKELLLKKDITEATANVILSDSKNPKYNQFDKLVQEDKDGHYSFK